MSSHEAEHYPLKLCVQISMKLLCTCLYMRLEARRVKPIPS